MKETIGKRIDGLRQLYGLSQKELAEEAGVTEVSMSRYINDLRIPGGTALSSIAKALHTTSDYLINGDYFEDQYFEIQRLINLYGKEFTDKQRLALIRAIADT